MPANYFQTRGHKQEASTWGWLRLCAGWQLVEYRETVDLEQLWKQDSVGRGRSKMWASCHGSGDPPYKKRWFQVTFKNQRVPRPTCSAGTW